MADDRRCPYCDGVIGPGKRGYPASRRKTCGSQECQRLHQKALIRGWGERNPGYYRDHKRQWRQRNLERHRQSTRAWWEANRETQYEINRRWREANRDRHAEMIRAWFQRNPALAAGYASRRRAVMVSGSVTERDWSRLVNRYGNRCFYCGAQDRLTIDHVVPLARGGGHTIGNVLPACLPCNASKQDRLLIEWRTGRHHRRRVTT